MVEDHHRDHLDRDHVHDLDFVVTIQMEDRHLV
jgi:hypothetical protein